MAEYGSFGAGMAAGINSGMGEASRVMQMGMQAQAAERAQQLEQMKVAGEAVKNFGSVLQDAPESQLPDLTKMFLGQMEQLSGVPIDPSVKAMILKDPLGAAHMLTDSFNNQPFTIKQLGGALGHSAAAIGLIDAYNKRKQFNDVSNASAMAYGAPGPSTPADTSSVGGLGTMAGQPLGTPLPTASAPVSALPTPGAPASGSPALGDLPAAQARINLIDKAIATTMQNINTPGAKERLQALQATRDSLDKSMQFAITNETMNQAAQMGINDITKASPQIRQLVQQRVMQQMGLGEQMKAQGQFLGGAVPQQTLEQTGANPFMNMAENRQQMGVGGGQGGQSQGSLAGPNGQPRLQSPQEIASFNAQLPDAVSLRKTYRDAADTASSGNDTLNQMRSLMPLMNKTGMTAPIRMKFDRLASAMGIQTEGLAPTQVFDMLSKKLSINVVTGLGQGSVSDQERDLFAASMPSISSDPKAIPIFIDMNQALNDRTIQRNQMLRQYQGTCGLTGEKCNGVSFDEVFNQWKNKNPMAPIFDSILKKNGYSGPMPGETPAPAQRGASVADFGAPTSPALPAATPALPTSQPVYALPTDTGGGAALVNPRGLRQRF